MTSMIGEAESDIERLGRLLQEKEQVLSKVMAERLRGRQLLTTVKEENRALTQGREIDSDKVKSLTVAVAASKKAAAEATLASNKSLEEARTLASTLEKRRRIAHDSTVALRAAKAEKEEMKRERDAFLGRFEQVKLEFSEDQFQARRLEEKLLETERRLKQAEDERQASAENGRADNEDGIRDEIIRKLQKKLNCSIVTNKPKEVVLPRCGHLFSRQCTDNLIASRNRKCPICGRAFGNDEVRNVFF